MQDKNITKLARTLRKNLTDVEQKLWYLLRSRRFYNYKFRRQFVIGSYIVDFCCYKRRLIVELDGGQHNEELNIFRDKQRQVYLEKLGYRILRVWNNEVSGNLDGIAERILNLLES